MKKLNRVIWAVILLTAFLLPQMSVQSYGVSYADFKPLHATEMVIGHTAIGSWNNGRF